MNTTLKLLAVILFIATSASSVPAGAAEEIDAALIGFLKSKAPEVYEELLVLADSDPESYLELLGEAAAARKEWERVSVFSTGGATAYLAMFRIDVEAVGVSDEIAESADMEKIAAQREELERLIGDSFDQWVIYERARLTFLEAELKRARAEFEENAGAKAEVVEFDVEALIEESRKFVEKRKSTGPEK